MFTFFSIIAYVAFTHVIVYFVCTSTMFTGITGTFVNIYLAMGSCVTRDTVTVVLVYVINASPSMFARVRQAFVYFDVTISAFISRMAFTSVFVDSIRTRAILTWIRITVINICFTEVTLKTINAVAAEAVDTINTRAIVKTHSFVTVINIVITVWAIVSVDTHTCVTIDLIVTSSVNTGTARTLVNVYGAVLSSITSSTVTGVTVHSVFTRRSILAMTA